MHPFVSGPRRYLILQAGPCRVAGHLRWQITGLDTRPPMEKPFRKRSPWSATIAPTEPPSRSRDPLAIRHETTVSNLPWATISHFGESGFRFGWKENIRRTKFDMPKSTTLIWQFVEISKNVRCNLYNVFCTLALIFHQFVFQVNTSVF